MGSKEARKRLKNRAFEKSPVVYSFECSVFRKTRFLYCILPPENRKLGLCESPLIILRRKLKCIAE
jgi:hypothetical protein